MKPSFADTDPIPEPLRQETFRLVWETVRDKYFDATMTGVDWNAVRTRYAGRVAETVSSLDVLALLNRMVRELPVTHLGVSPPGRTGVTSAHLMVPDTLELRANDEAVLVFSLTTDSPAWRAGLRPGFQVVAIDSTVLARPAPVSLARLCQLAKRGPRRLLAGPTSSTVAVRVVISTSRVRVKPFDAAVRGVVWPQEEERDTRGASTARDRAGPGAGDTKAGPPLQAHWPRDSGSDATRACCANHVTIAIWTASAIRARLLVLLLGER